MVIVIDGQPHEIDRSVTAVVRVKELRALTQIPDDRQLSMRCGWHDLALVDNTCVTLYEGLSFSTQEVF